MFFHVFWSTKHESHTQKMFLWKRFLDINVWNFFFNFQNCSDVFEYISSSNWSTCLNKHSNWRQLNPLKHYIVNFLDQPSSSDASDFIMLKKLGFLANIEVENSHIVLGRKEIVNFSQLYQLIQIASI